MKAKFILFSSSILFFIGCKKEYIVSNTQIKNDSIEVESKIAYFNNFVYFKNNQNINFSQFTENVKDTNSINIELDSKDANVGTTVNLYCYMTKGCKINIYPVQFGNCFFIYNNVDINSYYWYYNIVYSGNFNGDDIYTVNVYTN